LSAAFLPVASRGGLFFAGWPPAVRSVSSGLSLLPAGLQDSAPSSRGGFPYLPISPIFPISLFFPKSSPPFVPPPVFLHRVTRRSLFLPAGISGSVPASPAEKPRKLLFQNPEWLFSLRFFRISPGFSLSLKV
ncbi:MAG: hypothetical protein KBE84_06900, partial [Alistipes sp.]|nr:hypothetical protein [Alistipes sp.]